MRGRFLTLALGVAIAIAGCGADDDDADACVGSELRATGDFSGATGSGYGSIRLSTTASQPCTVRSGRVALLVTIAGRRYEFRQTRRDGINQLPSRVVIPTRLRADGDGTGIVFQWLENSCPPNGEVRLGIEIPELEYVVAVRKTTHVRTPRCDAPEEAHPVIAVSYLAPRLL